MKDEPRVRTCRGCDDPVSPQVARANQGFCFECEPTREPCPQDGMRIVRKELDSDD